MYSLGNPAFNHFLNEDLIKKADEEALNIAIYFLENKIDSYDDVAKFFIDFHHKSTMTIKHSKVNILDKFDKYKLAKIVKKWSILYFNYYVFLLKLDDKSDYKLHFRTPNLGLSPRRYSCLSIASRYAEYWAENSIYNNDIYDEWYERRDFIESEKFISLHKFYENDDILIYDKKGLSLPTFDLNRILVNEKNILDWSSFFKKGLYLVKLNENFSSYIEENYNLKLNHPGNIFPYRKKNISNDIIEVYFQDINLKLYSINYCYIKSKIPVYIILEKDLHKAFHILQSIKKNSDYSKIIFLNDLEDVVNNVFPNQPIKNINQNIIYKNILKYLGVEYTSFSHLDEWFFEGKDFSFRKNKNF